MFWVETRLGVGQSHFCPRHCLLSGLSLGLGGRAQRSVLLCHLLARTGGPRERAGGGGLPSHSPGAQPLLPARGLAAGVNEG